MDESEVDFQRGHDERMADKRDAQRYRKWRRAELLDMRANDANPDGIDAPDWAMHLAMSETEADFDAAIDVLPDAPSGCCSKEKP